MTLQDLKNNRERILNQIPSYYDVKKIMGMMVNMLKEGDNPTMKNIDKMVKVAKDHWVKYFFVATQPEKTTVIDLGPENLRRAMQNAPSSMRG